MIEFTTERLHLRSLRPEDAQEVSTLRSNELVNKYIVRQPNSSLSDATEFIDRITKSAQQDEIFYWAICLKETNELIGTVCLFHFSGNEKKAELGYELLPGFHSKGIMHETIRCIIQYAFTSLPLNLLEAVTHKENIASIRLLEKNGFTLTERKISNPEFTIMELGKSN
jgi:[ribosomal protein S5]-alanine N-acetyltransferase